MVGEVRGLKAVQKKQVEIDLTRGSEDGKLSMDMGGEGQKVDEGEEAQRLVKECLDKDLDGLGRPLKVSYQVFSVVTVENKLISLSS